MSISNVRPRLALRDLPPADAAERKADQDVMRHVFYSTPVPGGAQVGTDGTTWAVSLVPLPPRLADLGPLAFAAPRDSMGCCGAEQSSICGAPGLLGLAGDRGLGTLEQRLARL